MNDVFGLVLFKFVVVVVMGIMVFIVGGVIVEFLKVVIGGVLVGFVVSWLYGCLMCFFSCWGGDEFVMQIVLLFLLLFVFYLIVEYIGVFGILVVVVVGMIIICFGVMCIVFLVMCLCVNSIWVMLEFVFNGMVFLLLGLQLLDIFFSLLVVVEVDFNVEIWMLFIDIILIYVVLMLVCFGWLWLMCKFSQCFLKKKLMEFGFWIMCELLIFFVVGVCGVIIFVGVFFIFLLLLDGNVFLVCYELIFFVVGVILFLLFVGVIVLLILLCYIELSDNVQQWKEECLVCVVMVDVVIVVIQKMEECLVVDIKENIDI